MKQNNIIYSKIDKLNSDIKRIHEKLRELNIPKKERKRMRKQSIKTNNRHLIDYLNNQLGRLNKEKERLIILKETKDVFISIPWDYVKFEDNKVILSTGIEGKIWIIDNYLSRRSYNKILTLFKDRLDPLSVSIDAFNNARITNENIFLEVIKLLSIKNKMMIGDKVTLSDLLNISNNMDKLLIPKDKTLYLDYLSKSQSNKYKVIPIIEIANYGKNNLIYEEGFLFVIETRKPLIIWENINANRATYIFIANNDNVGILCQKIYDFLSSDIEFKRSRIRQSNINLSGFFGCEYIILYHTDFKEWKNKLLSI